MPADILLDPDATVASVAATNGALDAHAREALAAALEQAPEHVTRASLAVSARTRQAARSEAAKARERLTGADDMAAVMRAAETALAAYSEDEKAREVALDRAILGEPETVGRTAAGLLAETPEAPEWQIPGALAPGWMLKVAGREKSAGKGTLISHLLGRLERDEPSFFGEAQCGPTTAVIYTEEPPESIREKVARGRLDRALIVYGWELAGLAWAEKCARLAEIAREGGHGIIFVDNISRAAGVDEEAGVELARAAELLADAARAVGCSVIIDHHHKKGAGKLEDKSRGGTALAGACDCNIEVVKLGGWDSRVRKLSSQGRLAATIWERTVALSEDGTSYEIVADETQPQTSAERTRLRILSDAGAAGMTAGGFAKAAGVSDDTARRALGEFVVQGWADEDDAYPRRWRSTGDGADDLNTGLDGPYNAEGLITGNGVKRRRVGGSLLPVHEGES